MIQNKALYTNFPFEDRVREKCGVVGIWTASNHAGPYVRRSLASLQHRGQESAGVSLLTPKNTIITHKGMGLVPHVITEDVLKKLGNGKTAIGQNRYGTSGRSTLENAQPFVLKKAGLQLSIGHNGNIPDIAAIRKKIGAKNVVSDTSLMAMYLMNEQHKYTSWEETLTNVLPEFKGAYCLTIITNDGSLFGVRDPYGIRPLCLGKLHDGWIIASESVALDSVGAEFVRDIKPGEIVKIDKKGALTSYFFGEPKHPQNCLFEYIYFSRPDSFINGRRVKAGRELSGKFLAQRIRKKGIKPDVVVPTFDSGYPAAKGAAEELQIPIVDAITTSHYVGRTFIQPGQENRIAAVSGKHNIVPDEIMGKKIMIVDDSAVRLTTSKMLAKAFRQAGAKKIYMAFASPPVINQCDMGIDMRSKKELPAALYEKLQFDQIEKQIATHVGADEIVYLPIEETAKAFGGTKEDFYWFPFGGPHPLRGKQPVFAKRKKKSTGKQKIVILISGKGTFVQDIIDSIEKGEMHAEIPAIISNKPDAPGLERAKKHHIQAIALPYKGKLADETARKTYEKELIDTITNLDPDVLLLSGWQMILSSSFVKKMQDLGIPVINHHPALLTDDTSDAVSTSRGKIPILRGSNVWKKALDDNLPVAGISVHQIVPGDGFDIGPVILKSEVRIHENETPETLKHRMNETEHALVPAAMKRVLHVINHHNIDISKGDFKW